MVQTRLIRIAFLALLGAATLFILPSGSSDEGTLEPEPDPRAYDRDWCHVNDFWSGEVVGLYRMSDAAATDEAIRLIELSVASADFRGCDGGSRRIADFWTTDVWSLLTTTPESDEPE